ncbi:hypothetical protein ACWDBO_03455 [Streptomyces mirabilis]|uniref:hypothetical protein n=1 Tax=Streptomyces TaxID=1883 RepID=UPI0029AE946E|nr:hypothetical protein [Streptomyces sp. AK02-04a]MDX3754222.1 hypothetical protein [Streptomyces sp. AK02-04a]
MKFGPDRPGPSTTFAGRSVSRPWIRLDLTGMTAEDWAHAEASSTPMPGPTAACPYLDTQPFSNDCATP